MELKGIAAIAVTILQGLYKSWGNKRSHFSIINLGLANLS